MLDTDRGKPNATSQKELWRILALANANKNDGFCDLGCGYGNLCRWAVKKVNFAIGTEDHHKRYRLALRSTKKISNVKILNENYRKLSTLRKLRKCSIFYCINGESFGFYQKLQKAINHKAWLIVYDYPPYPIKATKFDGLFYAVKIPFEFAKTKKDWINSITKNGSLKDYRKRYIKDFKTADALEEMKFDVDENIDGIDWLIQKRR